MILTEENINGYNENLKQYENYDEIIRKTYSGKSIFTQFEVTEGGREFIATITTDKIDRDAEIVDPAGINLTNFRKNPIIMLQHESWELPIGKALWIKRFTQDGVRGLLAKGQIAEGIERADDVFKLMQQGILITTSMGFGAKEIEFPTEEDIKKDPKRLRGVKRIIAKSELFEFSIVAIPANTDATIHAVSKGLVPDWIKDQVKMPDPVEIIETPKPVADVAPVAEIGQLADIQEVAQIKESPMKPEKVAELAAIETNERYATRVLGKVSN